MLMDLTGRRPASWNVPSYTHLRQNAIPDASRLWDCERNL